MSSAAKYKCSNLSRCDGYFWVFVYIVILMSTLAARLNIYFRKSTELSQKKIIEINHSKIFNKNCEFIRLSLGLSFDCHSFVVVVILNQRILHPTIRVKLA